MPPYPVAITTAREPNTVGVTGVEEDGHGKTFASIVSVVGGHSNATS